MKLINTTKLKGDAMKKKYDLSKAKKAKKRTGLKVSPRP